MSKIRHIREVLLQHRTISQEQESENPSDRYNVDRRSINGYFWAEDSWRREVAEYFSSISEKGEAVVHLDICGRAHAQALGADRSYCFSYRASEATRLFADDSTILVDGDLFDSPSFFAFMDLVKQDEPPALATFNPVAGLGAYAPLHNRDVELYEQTTYSQLSKRLEDILDVVRPGGYVFLTPPFQSSGLADFFARKPQQQWWISGQITSLAQKKCYQVRLQNDLGGPYFLLKKQA